MAIVTSKIVKNGSAMLPVNPEETGFHSLSLAIATMMQEGWGTLTFAASNVAVLRDHAGNRPVLQHVA